MSNSKNGDRQIQLDTPRQSGQDTQHRNAPSEKSFFQEKGLIFEDDLGHSDSFSLEDLRSNFPDPIERVGAIWGFLAAELADRAVGLDRCFADLAMLDELVHLGKFKIRDNERECLHYVVGCRNPLKTGRFSSLR